MHTLVQAVNTLFPDTQERDSFLSAPTEAILKKVFRAQAYQFHPDRNEGRTHERFISIRKAYEHLSSVQPAELRRMHSSHNPGRGSAPPKSNTFTQAPRQSPQAPKLPVVPKYTKVDDEVYYDGELPDKHLLLGMFLYYTGKISFRMLAHGLAWQRGLRPSLGAIAIAWDILSQYDVDWILQSCGITGRFGERALKMGYISAGQLNLLIRHQMLMQTPLGRFFAGNKILSESQINQAISDLRKHNAGITG